METRARKLRRIQRETRASRYLDVVPRDILFHLVKHLSKWPNSDQWFNSVDEVDALTILQIDGPLGDVSQEMFKSLNDNQDFGYEKFGLLAPILAPHVQSLYLDVDRIRGLDCRRFSSLRTLEVSIEGVSSKILNQILASSGGTLVELGLNYRSGGAMRKADARNIARHCKSLKSLDVEYFNATSLKVIWETLGGTLTKFSGCIPLGDFPLLVRHCTVLEELKLSNIPQLKDEDPRLVLDSLEALQSLKVLGLTLSDGEFQRTDMTVEEIETFVGRRQSNFLFDIDMDFGSRDNFSRTMRAIGCRLRLFSLVLGFDSIPSERSWGLKNIQELEVVEHMNRTDYGIERLFVQPMPKLQRLHFSLKNTSVFRNIAHSVPNLSCLICDLPTEDDNPNPILIVDASDVTELLTASKKLNRLDLDFGAAEPYPTNHMINFVSCLKISEAKMHVIVRYNTGYNYERVEYSDSDSGPEYQNISKEQVIDREKLKRMRDASVPLRTKEISLQIARYGVEA